MTTVSPIKSGDRTSSLSFRSASIDVRTDSAERGDCGERTMTGRAVWFRDSASLLLRETSIVA
jgi:hypothetical protein